MSEFPEGADQPADPEQTYKIIDSTVDVDTVVVEAMKRSLPGVVVTVNPVENEIILSEADQN